MTTRRVYIDGHACWSPSFAADAAARPAPALLNANERRRASISVLAALQVAEAAVAMSGHDPARLGSVFTSAHGDLAIVDALCATLAADPLLLSPTRFHQSVHNAASGYWAIASGSRCGSSALAAFGDSFAAGWLEAAVLCAADERPVLLVGFDTEACGALASANSSRGLLAVALLLSPVAGPRSCRAADWSLVPAEPGTPDAAPPLPPGHALAANPMAAALPLFDRLAADAKAGSTAAATTLTLRASPHQHLVLRLQPAASA